MRMIRTYNGDRIERQKCSDSDCGQCYFRKPGGDCVRSYQEKGTYPCTDEIRVDEVDEDGEEVDGYVEVYYHWVKCLFINEQTRII